MTSTPTTAPGLDRDLAMTLSVNEIARYADLLASLDEAQWQAPTECSPWTVRDMAGHVLGTYEGLATIRGRLSQLVDARRHGGNLVDALSATQIARRVDRTPSRVVDGLRRAAAPSVAGRRRVPRALRAMKTTVPMRHGKERWSIAFLDDVVYTRDTWMHRMDTCRAVNVEPVLTADHDALIVADIVREWASRHGEPFSLTLRGPAGGTFGSGGGEAFDLDAVEFCRLLSGRGNAEGLLAVEVAY